MEKYSQTVEVRWSDLDPNFHLRHSVYYDWGAYVRMRFLTQVGLTPQVMMQEHFGLIIFREEAVFKREIHFGDTVEVTLQLAKSLADGTRWTMVHEVWKYGEILSAIITVDGAWLNTQTRKLAVLPSIFLEKFEMLPKVEGFEWG